MREREKRQDNGKRKNRGRSGKKPPTSGKKTAIIDVMMFPNKLRGEDVCGIIFK